MIEPETHFDAQPSVSNHFAWLRTMVALQRTQLAVVRTAVSLIGFGFTVAQFFEKMVHETGSSINPARPRNVGMVLIATGVLSLAAFTWHFNSMVRYLRSGDYAQIALSKDKALNRPAFLISYVVMAIGTLAFGSIFFHF